MCIFGALGRVHNSRTVPAVICQVATAMSDVMEGSLNNYPPGTEDKSSHGRHSRKGSLHKDLSRSRSSSSQWENSRQLHKQDWSRGSESAKEWVSPPTHPLPNNSQDEVNSPHWSMAMGALAELWAVMKKNEERNLAIDATSDASSARDLEDDLNICHTVMFDYFQKLV